MSNQHLPKQKKSIASSDPFQPEQLARYADRLGRDYDGHVDDKIFEIVDWALEHHKDAFLKQALSLVRTAAGWEELWDTVSFNASVRHPGETDDDETAVELITVPLILSLDGNQHREVPRDVPDVAPLTASLRAHGLYDPADEKLNWFPHLWSLDELNSLTFTEVGQLATLISAPLMGAASDQAAPGIPGMPFQAIPLQGGARHLVLRFLVGVMVYPGGRELPFLRKGIGENLLAWRKDASELFGHALNTDALALDPGNFYVAQGNAVTDFRLTELDVRMHEALKKNGVAPATARVIISAHTPDRKITEDCHITELRIAAYPPATDERMLGYVWELAPFEDAEEIAERIGAELIEDDITDVVVKAEILPTETDPSTGGPRFVQPEPASPMPPMGRTVH